MASRITLARRVCSSTAQQPSARPSSFPGRRFASSSSSSGQAHQQLDWPTYLALRRSQRLYGLVASIPTTALGFSAGAGYFATIESDPTDLVFGVEPVYVYAAATLGCVALGWLAGPTVGGAMWRLTHRGVGKAMEAKDKEFFKHVSRWRADPTRQSATNPAPDYYAEKVGSLRQYRSWLRDQNIFRRKAAFGEKNEAVY
ncbi:hypothetical protein JCM3774_001834 [Rhodotorula dairenensis]